MQVLYGRVVARILYYVVQYVCELFLRYSMTCNVRPCSTRYSVMLRRAWVMNYYYAHMRMLYVCGWVQIMWVGLWKEVI